MSATAKVPPEQKLEELAKGPDGQNLMAFLRRHRKLLQAETVQKLTEAARESLRTDVPKSLRLAESALSIAEEIRDEESQARALRAKANALWFLNQNKLAVELYEQAISLFQKIGNATEVGRTISSSIQPLIRLGEYERALQGAERAREIFSSSGDGLRLARLELNVANIFHRQDRFADAEAMYERAYQQLLAFKDTEGIGVALHNMAVCLISLNEFQKALERYETARTYCREHGMPALVAQADYNIAYLYYLRGEYSRALHILKATREESRQNGDYYHTALCNLDQSEIYLELNMSDEAAEMAQEAVTQFQALGMRFEAARSLTNLAIAFGRRGQAARSLELFSQAKDIFVQEDHQVWPSMLDLYQALVLYNDGRFVEAHRLCSDALQFFRSSGIPTKEVLCELLQARIFLRTTDLDSARLGCQNALQRLAELDAPHLTYQAYFLQGEIEEAAGNPSKAADSYQAAKSAMETLRSVLRGEELKIAFMKNKQEVYQSLIRLCLAKGVSGAAAEEVFGYIQQAKSRTLQDVMLERPEIIGVKEAGQTGVARQIQELREELNWYYHRIELQEVKEEGSAPERIGELRAEAQKREKNLLRLLRELPASEAEATGVAGSLALNLDSIRASLNSDSTLIGYFRVDERIIAALLTKETLEIVPLAHVSRVKNALQMLDFQLSKFRLGPDYVRTCGDLLMAATTAHLQELYQELVAPMRQRLHGRRLIITPHELLHHLPFHALFDGSRYLIDSFSISYAPSASIYALCHQKAVNTSGPSLILGIPDAQAPFIADEIRSVAETLPQPELFMGSDATQSALKELGPHSRLVHIATHGRFREDNPMFSAIRLGDAYLTLYDLYQLRLPAELVTLSGCSTGLNVVAAGDELLGLVRGLLYAGAQSLLLTLWDVNDRSTADFMKSFYSRLKSEPSKATALQAAMQELRQRKPHPYYWAPFVLMGRG